VCVGFCDGAFVDCGDNDAGDDAFITATRSISGRDVVEKYMACRLFPLSACFGLGEVKNRETSALKITLPLPEFPIARLSEETNNHFRAKVQLAA
jgi:hypothetical protein